MDNFCNLPFHVLYRICVILTLQLNTEWVQIEAIDLTSDGSAWGFGITGGRSTGVVVKTIVPGSVADKVIFFQY